MVNEEEILTYCFPLCVCNKEKDLNSLESKLPEKPNLIHYRPC